MFPTKHTSEVCKRAIAALGAAVLIAAVTVGSASSNSQAASSGAATEGQVGGVPSLIQIPVNFSLADLFQRCETMLPNQLVTVFVDMDQPRIDACRAAQKRMPRHIVIGRRSAYRWNLVGPPKLRQPERTLNYREFSRLNI